MKPESFLKNKLDLNKLSKKAKQVAYEEQLSKRSERINEYQSLDAGNKTDRSAQPNKNKDLKQMLDQSLVRDDRSKSSVR